MSEWRELQLVRRLKVAVEHLSEARRRAVDDGRLPGHLSELAFEAGMGWACGVPEEEWVREHRVDAGEREYLRDTGVWPWGRDRELDWALQEAHLGSTEMVLSAT